ncbi:hypothetical protein SAMN05192533_101114 [Mesobacillus persicus]|uniref:Uncharacterized protein n=1 Tax=Mesobacillus persicus TaxID=930146 RepID=A0A1H7VTV4_9BACI|nr:hypothetical protein [Mesobacillus persicus]SEM12646.1 hypothetical protein SAMN05192533_101114 [Mesobacillus persicus]
MRRPKKYNKYPYLILLFIHTSLLVFSFYKNKDRKRLFLLLSSNIGLAYLFDYFVVNLFKAYSYRPSIFRNKQLDEITGAIFSQAIFVPFTALFITSFHLDWKFKLGASLYFSIIEKLFVKMGVYTHHWWKTSYTTLLIPIYFLISDKWYQYLKQGHPAVLFASKFHLILITCVNLLFVRAVRRKIRFGFGSFHSWREHFIIGPLYSIVLSFFTAKAMKVDKVRSQIGILCFRLVVDFILIKLNWLKLIGNKKGLPNLPYHLLMIIASRYYHNLVYKKDL